MHNKTGGYRAGSGRKPLPPSKLKRIPVDAEDLVNDLLAVYCSINSSYPAVKADSNYDRLSLFLEEYKFFS